MWTLYNLLLNLTLPIWGPWMRYRASKRKESPNWAERYGRYPMKLPASPNRVWIHAVSVGEVVASLPILQELKSRPNAPEIVLSVTTSTGHATAQSRAAGLFDHLVYFPIDIFRFQLAAMVRVRPRVAAIMETELWMNFLSAAKDLGATTMLINGRISDRSFPRSMKVRFFYAAMLTRLDQALMQTALDAERIQALGAASADVLGNCKFDQAADERAADPAHWRSELKIAEGKKVVVIGSTRGEIDEDFVLEALGHVDLTGVTVIHAPRHIESAPQLGAKVAKRFGSVAFRSKGETGDYQILDTLGELSSVYCLADVAVIGGGFDNLGGQNLLQPLAHGIPTLHGVHMQNFADVTAMATKAGCSIACESPESLGAEIANLLDDPARRERMKGDALALVDAQVGASKRYADAIVAALAANPGTKAQKGAK